MSESFWDVSFEQPLQPRDGRPLRTLRDADEFVRNRCARLAQPLASAALGALNEAARSGQPMDTRRAFHRTARLMRENRWGWG